MSVSAERVQIDQNIDGAVEVMHHAGQWLEDSGMNPSKWWRPENLNPDFLLQYAKSDEFYLATVNGEPAAAAILQTDQSAQDWPETFVNRDKPAVFIHWLCVERGFAGRGLPKAMVDFAAEFARQRDIEFLRVDTNADEHKLRSIYETLDFSLVGTEEEPDRTTAFYEKRVA
jgi:GNAT superfamily N-acetyltransferase